MLLTHRKALGVFLALIPLLSSCSLKKATPDVALEVTFPGGKPLRAPASVISSGKRGTLTVDNTKTLTCVGVNVFGPGIAPSTLVSSCTPPGESTLGIYAEIVPIATGGSFSLIIPTGPSRVIQVFGITTSDGICPAFADYLKNTSSQAPYLLASQTVDLFSSTTVNLETNWDPNAPKTAFCTPASAPGLWDTALWDGATWAP